MGKTARRVSAVDPSSPTSPYLYYESQLATSEITTAINIAPVSADATNATIDVSSIDSLSTEWSTAYNHSLLATLTQSPTEGSSQIKNVNNNKTLSLPSSTTIGSVTSTQETTTTKATTSTATTIKTTKAKTNSSMYQSSSPSSSSVSSTTTTLPTQSHVTTTLAFNNSNISNSTLESLKREKLRMEFYATYDVMTGIRIAATLGGFFVLMVFLIVYKSRSHTNKGLDDPKVKAAATAVVEEEEERELQEAIEKTAFSLYQEEMDFVPPIEMRLQRDRMLSLGNVSCPPMILNPNMRFSSIGGYSSLLEPSRRFSESSRLRRQSTSDSSRVLSAYHLNDNYNNQNENFFNESDGEEADDEFEQFTTTAEIANTQSFLSVPMGQDSRRSSGMTCCSTESSFLERRCSAITLGLSSLPTISRSSSRRASRVEWEPELQYGPGIHIIEPTPKSSPNPSERHEKMKVDRIKLKQRYDDNSIDSITEYPDEPNNCNDDYAVNLTTTNNNNSIHQSLESSCNNNSNSNTNNMNINLAAITSNNNNNNTTDVTRRAPLASLSSFKMSSAEFQDFDLYQKSGSDSVFVESCADTDEDMDQFSTDSDEISLIQTPPPEENSIEQQQIFSINLDDSSLFKISNNNNNNNNNKCDPRGASVSVVNIETDILSRKFRDDSNQLSHIEINKQHQEHLQQQQQPQSTQIYKSNSANLFDIERHQQNDTMKRRPASSGCLFSSNFNNAFTNESSISFNNDNNSSSRSNITVLRASTPDWGGGATANSNNDSNSNSYKNHSCSNQSNECIQINVIDSDVASSHTLPTTTIHSSTPQSSTSNDNIINNNNNNNSSSVILELPVITAQIESSSSSSQVDPCIPGTSRKWSKETLF